MNNIELITIQQSFPYPDPTTAETTPGWVTILQPYANMQIGQGKEFWAAQKNNVELKGIAQLIQYFSELTNDKTLQVICSQGTYSVGWIIEFRDKIPWRQELHLKKVS